MTTKPQILDKVHELLSKNNQHALDKIEQYLNSGAIDVESYDDDYRLPKILMSAAMAEMSWQWRPHTDEDRKVVNNLKHF